MESMHHKSMIAGSSIIQSQLPEYVESSITTVRDLVNDVTFKLVVPYPAGSIQSGTGGGWLDSSPFPQVNTTTYPNTCYSSVLSVIDSTHFSIITWSAITPTINSTRISWIDKLDNFSVKTATVVGATTASVAAPYTWILTIDTPFPTIILGDYIFPALKNGQTYVDAVLQHFSQMGPGEKTDVASLIPRALRKPRSNTSYPNSLEGSMLKTIINSSTEVESCDYYYRKYSVAPTLPYYIYDSPYIFIANNIGFYPEEN